MLSPDLRHTQVALADDELNAAAHWCNRDRAALAGPRVEETLKKFAQSALLVA